MPMKVLIATPVYGDTVSSGYHSSILETIGFFAREFPHIEFVHQVRSTSFFPHVRNILASDVLNDASYTHLLLIDPDIGFSPSLTYTYVSADSNYLFYRTNRNRLSFNLAHYL